MKKTVGIVGAGAWGTALAVVVARGGNPVILWSAEEKIAKEINEKRRNSYLDGVSISREIIATNDMADLARADVWLIATPTEFFRETIQSVYATLRRDKKSRPFESRRSASGDGWQKQPIIICSKGIEPQTGKLLSDVVMDVIPSAGRMIGVLGGPSFAFEVAMGKPTGATIAGPAKVRDAARSVLSGFVLEDSNDVYGVQICGAGRVAIAMLLGYMEGKGAGENERAMKLTQAWQEIMRFGRHFVPAGAEAKAGHVKTDTFSMLCGIGDLFLTASSKNSRNYSAGLALAKGQEFGGTVEGVAALKWIVSIARKNKLHLPVLMEFSKVI